MVDKTSGGFLMSQIRRVGSRVFDRILQRADIDAFNGAQGRILYVLWQSDNIPIVELSEKTGLAKTTLTSMLDRMESQNLVRRIPDQKDRRQIRIVLTPMAKRLEADYNSVSTQINEIYYEGFSDEEILHFESYLTRILENLKREEQTGRQRLEPADR